MNSRGNTVPATTARAVIFAATTLSMIGTFYAYDCIAPDAELLSRIRGFSDTDIGLLNAVYSLPNIVLVLLGGVLIDRYHARTVTVCTATICLIGAVLTAVDGQFGVMVFGRLLFGVGAETLFVAIYAALSEWLQTRHFAFLLALNLSLGRLGSYLADLSPLFAHSLYDRGWQPPLWLGVGFAAIGLVGAIVYWIVDRHEAERTTLAASAPRTLVHWRSLLRLPAEYWYLVGLCVAFYSAILPFRSTFAIKYFQQAQGLTLDQASRVNSFVFMAAVIMTPIFGLLVDRVGRSGVLMIVGSLLLPVCYLLLATGHANLWITTALLGVSFSLIPAVLWPSVTRHVPVEYRGTAYGLMAVLQNAGLTVANLVAGYLNDRGFASVAHPEGYIPMLCFFGLLGFLGLIFAALLQWSGEDRRWAAA